MIYILQIIFKNYMAWVILYHNMQTDCETLYVDMVDIWKHSPLFLFLKSD
jgi:hypothetical protein